MKVLVAALFLLLCTVALCSQDNYTPLTCCYTYVSRKIPRQLVVDYFKTSSTCPTNGIIFHTKRGKNLCANPSDAWVQEYIKNLEKNP